MPDAITSALELQKGSADLASNVLTLDMVHQLRRDPNLEVETGLGSQVFYLTFNVTDPLLKDKRVRQASGLRDRPASHRARPVAQSGSSSQTLCCRLDTGQRQANRRWRSIRTTLRGRSACSMRPAFIRTKMACG